MLDADAIRLAKELDGLPLALATAGAYLNQAAISFLDYLRLYKESWARLQKTSPELSSYEDRTLYSTWQISFDYIKKQNRLSAKLLQLWGYFDNQDLWLELLQHSDSEDPDWIRELAEDEISFHGVVRVLGDHGLVEVHRTSQELIESRGYSIHGCVHSWIIHVLNKEWDCNLARMVVKFIGSHVPGGEDVRPWPTQQRLLQHVGRCSDIVLNDLATEDGMAWAIHELGRLYRTQDKPAAAEQMYQRALQGYEKAWGPEHTSTLGTVNNLGNLYKSLDRLEDAELMYQRALHGYEKAWGPEHTSTLDTVNNLGSLYKSLGRLEDAELMYQRALYGYEKAWGPEHTSTLNTVNNLGNLYTDLGRLEDAELMYQRALHGKEKAWGPEHTSTLDTVNNLGGLYTDLGRLEDAELMYQRALHGKEKAWGPEHTSTLDTVNNLGSLYADLGKLEDAEQMYQRALQGYEKALGADNVMSYIPALNTIYNLGSLFESQADLLEARTMYSKALVGYKEVFGPDHLTPQRLEESLRALDTVTEQQALSDVEEPVTNLGRNIASRC